MAYVHWSKADDSIKIALVSSSNDDTNGAAIGAQIAVDQINADGGLLGHPLSISRYGEEIYTDKVALEKLVSKTLQLATRIGEQPGVLAVIGHGSSATAVPASAIYESHRKLFLATQATASTLSNHHFDLTFALQPDNADNAAFLAKYARSQDIRKVVVLSDNSGYGIETTNQFRSLFAQQGGTILYRGRLTTINHSIEDLLLFLMDNEIFKSTDIDAFFVTSSSWEETAQFIIRTRQLGLTIPILGPEYLNTRKMNLLLDKDSLRDVVTVSVFDSDKQTPEGHRLTQDFVKVLGYEPGMTAALNFDAVKVLAYAAKRAGSLDPSAIADTLRIMRYDHPFIGATGTLSFDSRGLATDTTTHILRHDGNHFRSVAAYRKPLADMPRTNKEAAEMLNANERTPE